MAVIMLSHFKVTDQAKWRQVFDSNVELRKAAGCLGTHVFHNAHDPNDVLVNFQWDSEENATQFMSSAEARAAMADAGLLGPPQMWFVTDGGRTPA
jgi:heme-degrading monooxygenase HmoA